MSTGFIPREQHMQCQKLGRVETMGNGLSTTFGVDIRIGGQWEQGRRDCIECGSS